MKFTGGPAEGKHLMFKRCPLFLRITISEDKVDGLDQLKDVAREDETVHAYRRTSDVTRCFVDGEKCHDCFSMADYEYMEPQPDEEMMHDNERWREWCQEQQRAKA